MEKIHWLNYTIDQLNKSNNMTRYPKFAKFRVRIKTNRWIDRFGQEHHRAVRSHRWEQWRESDRSRMLHLTNEMRFKLGKAVNQHFVLRT